MFSILEREDDHGLTPQMLIVKWIGKPEKHQDVGNRCETYLIFFVFRFQEKSFLHLDWVESPWSILMFQKFQVFSIIQLSARLHSLPTGHKLWARFGIWSMENEIWEHSRNITNIQIQGALWSTENEIWEHSTNTQLDTRVKGSLFIKISDLVVIEKTVFSCLRIQLLKNNVNYSGFEMMIGSEILRHNMKFWKARKW